MSDILITFGLIVLICLGTFIWFLIQSFFADRRTKACSKAADELGLDFQESDQEMIECETPRFQLMQQGHSREHRNVLTATTDEVTIRLFDYKYAKGSGRNETTYYQTVAMISPSEFELPSFHAKPERLLEQLSSLLGYQDIDFPRHDAFSSTFRLTSPSEEATREFLDDSLLDFFALCPKITFESIGDAFLFYELKHSVKPKNLHELLKDAYRIFGLLRDRAATASESPASSVETAEAVLA